MTTSTTLFVTALGLSVAATLQAEAASTFTFDPTLATPNLGGAAFTADNMTFTNYLHSTVQGNGSFAEFLCQPISSFTLDGAPVTAPGLNSSYGLYLTVTATGTLIGGVTSYSSLGISLMADVGHNDGSPIVTTGSPGSPGSINFSNPAGVVNDVVLGSGSLISASMSKDAANVRHATFVTTFAPAPGEQNFFVSPTAFTHLELEEILTTLPSQFTATTPDATGEFEIAVSGGSGDAQFQVPEPASALLLGCGLLGLGMLRRRRVRDD